MFLSGVLFVLFLAGCWLYCLTDAALTPAAEFPGLRKPVWLTAIAVTFIVGAIAWLIARKMWRAGYWPRSRPRTLDRWLLLPDRGPHESLRGAPRRGRGPGPPPGEPVEEHAEPALPIGPDDDPEFLRELTERIRGAGE